MDSAKLDETDGSEEKSAYSVHMLDAFLEHFPGPAFIRNSDSVYLRINREFQRLFASANWIGKLPEEIYDEETARVLHERDREVLEKGYTCRRRELEFPERGMRTLETHYFRIEQPPDAPLIGGIALDITDRLKTESALARSEEKYRAIYDNTGTAMVILDPQGLIVSANANIERLSGFLPEEVVGKCHWTEFVHPSDLNAVAERRRRRMESTNGLQMEYEFRLRRKDNSYRHVRMCTGTIPNSGGMGVLSLSDITSLIEYQKQLNISLEKTQAILEAIPDIMFVLSRDGKYLDFYTRDISRLAVPAENLADSSIFDIGLPEEKTLEIIQVISDTIDNDRVNTIEYELDMPDGHRFYEAGMSPFEADSVLVLCRDVTARKTAEDQQKRLEAQIRHVQKLESLGVLSGGIAHDFNNLMMAVTGNVHLARQAALSGACPLQYLDAVDQAAGRAADLSEQMLAYSGRGEFRVLPLDLNSVAGEISGILSATVSKKAKVVFKLDPDLPLILADNTQVRQVVMNLLTNASESLEQNAGTITISTGTLFCSDSYLGTLHKTEKLRVGNYAWIQVDDTGNGMDEALMNRIFDPFFTTKFTGRGLGLSAVLGIMSSHAGGLAIRSKPGLGSSFRALFPVADTDQFPAGEPDIADENWTATGTALFVDDEPLIRSVGKEMLSDIGFNVITAVDGLDALNRFKSSMDVISILIIDLTMPNLDGDELFREIRKLRKDIPVIISSGYNESEIISRFMDVSPEGFLKKPYTARQLKEKIRALLGR